MLLEYVLATLKGPEKHVKTIKRVLHIATRLKVDNVARYLEETINHGEPFVPDKMFPNIAPLAPAVWHEYTYSIKDERALAGGCIVLNFFDRKRDPIQDDDDYLREHADVRWVLALQTFNRTQEGLLVSTFIRLITVSDEGQLLNTWPVMSNLYNGGKLDAATYERMEQDYAIHWSAPELVAMLATTFAHCKGTTIEEQPVGRHQRRMAARTGRPALTFKTLDIRPVARLLRDEGGSERTGLQRSLHICRGHFVHYGPDAPLFGKLVGTFYHPLHARGSLKHGAVVKDYRSHVVTKEEV